MWGEHSEQMTWMYWIAVCIVVSEWICSLSLDLDLALSLCLSLSVCIASWLAGPKKVYIKKICVWIYSPRYEEGTVILSDFSKLCRMLFSFSINVFSFLFYFTFFLYFIFVVWVVTRIQKHAPPSPTANTPITLRVLLPSMYVCAHAFGCVLNFSPQNNRTVLFLIPNKWIAALFHLMKIFRTKASLLAAVFKSVFVL